MTDTVYPENETERVANAHTPGPWLDFKVADVGFKVYRGVSDGEAICQMFDKNDEPFLNDAANARLIAAAPEMLKALHTVRAFINSGDYDRAETDAVCAAAIAKATGR